MKLEGLYTALVTPVADNAIDKGAFNKLIDYVLAGGSDGLVVLGGTGEYPALSREQRIAAVEICKARAGDRVPVVVGILSPGLYDSIEMGKISRELGADAVMLVTPYYVIADQKGLVDYYLRFMDAVDLPLVLYNIPYRTMVNMQPETVAEIFGKSGGQVVGIKECVPNIGQASKLISLTGDSMSFVCGEEFLLCSETIMGAKAAILATSNLIPGFWKTMLDAIRNGDVRKATAMHMEALPFLSAVFAETNPGPLKMAMKLAGLDCGNALPPLHAPDDKLMERLKNELKRIEKWLP